MNAADKFDGTITVTEGYVFVSKNLLRRGVLRRGVLRRIERLAQRQPGAAAVTNSPAGATDAR